ncbi:MAG: fimbrillin family protein [Bacteroidales bacterium]|nr:fimbrillin family protein [Bacteroidales bacterium]
MRYKISIFLAAALLAVFACSKNPDSPAEVIVIDDSTPQPVLFSSNLSSVRTTTKAVGAIDRWSGNDSLFVFSLDRETKGVFIDNVLAYSPSDGVSGDINLYNSAATAPNEPFYYGEGYYDFFAYYLDGAAINKYKENEVYPVGTPVVDVDQENNLITVDVAIDGTQDIMIAKADVDRDTEGIEINKAKVYSAYSARRGVKPDLLFKHQLSRFKFEIISGSQIVADNVYVVGLSVESDSLATFAVAGNIPENNLIESSHPGFLKLWHHPTPDAPLTILDGSESSRIKCPAYTPKTDTTSPRDTVKIDGSILAIPGKSVYKLNLDLYQEGYTAATGVPRDLEIDFANITGGTGAGKAEAGYQYKVYIYVYGLEIVEVKVTLDEWKDGGTVTIDPDEN